jgi:hypothetical protein
MHQLDRAHGDEGVCSAGLATTHCRRQRRGHLAEKMASGKFHG